MKNQIKREQIAKEIYFSGITDKRFKLNRISINIFSPLREETAAENALLSFILSRTTKFDPTFTQLSKKLSKLYGANFYSNVLRIGDSQVITLSISSIDDRYALEGEEILKEISSIIISALLHPVLEGEAFPESAITLEKKNLIDTIYAEINEKQTYAVNRGMEELCKGEPAGISKYGTVDAVEKITGKSIYSAYKKLIHNSRIEVVAVGCNDFKETEEIFKSAFSSLERGEITPTATKSSPLKPTVKEEVEEMAVSQCKLVLGFKTDSLDTNALSMFQRVFGGTTTSKLFVNVREKLSLCYYCSAIYDDGKKLILVHSGVEKENIEKAKEEIIAQLKAIQDGNITDDELSHARLFVKNSAKSVYDTTSGIENWYLSRIYKGDTKSPQEVTDGYISASKEDIVKAANSIKLDTIYTLISQQPKEEAHE